VPEAAIEDLRSRLDHTRWPERFDGNAWTYGVKIEFSAGSAGTGRRATTGGGTRLCSIRSAAIEARSMAPTSIFLPLLSQEPDALPIVPTHGSPGSPHHRGGGPTPLPRRYWNEQPRGSHFAAFEVPDLFIDDVRAFARLVH
jgi:epoxide hydrolase